MIAPKTTFPCQQCGGAAVPVPGRSYLQCSYCRSLVFTTDNPLSIDRVTPLEGELDAACPVCRDVLRKGLIEDRAVLYCGSCYGLLMSNGDFGAIVSCRRARRLAEDTDICEPIDPKQYRRQIECPNCCGAMEVHPYYGPGNIVMDSCYTCQFVWLDSGELRTVERSQGGREPELLPLHVNSSGDVTVIPPPQGRSSSDPPAAQSPLSVIADLLFGLS